MVAASPDSPLVLIVDDSATVRSIVRVHLVGHRVRFREAGSAEDALTIIKTDPVRLIVLDRNLPGMNGAELVRLLRSDENPQIRELPIIMLTGDPSDELAAEATAAGVSAFVRKPVNQSGLSDAVSRFLPRAS